MNRSSLAWLPGCLVLMSCTHTPETPQVPVGSAWAIADAPAEFVVSAAARGAVSCRVDWGDGDTSIWTQWVTSGVQVATSHAWDTAGLFSVGAQARSSDGALSNWSGPASVRVLPRPGYPNRVIGSANLHWRPSQVILSPDGSRLLARNFAGEIAILRTSDLAIEASGSGFRDALAVGWDGLHAYGLQDGVITKYRVPDLVVVASLALGDTLEPQSIVASPSQDELYVLASSLGTGMSEILVVNGESLAVIGSMGRLFEPYGPKCSPDGQAMYVCGATSLYRFDVTTRAQTGVVHSLLFPEIVAASADGRWIYVTDESEWSVSQVDAASLAVTVRLPQTNGWFGFAASPSGLFLFNRTEELGVDSMAVFETGTWRRVAKFAIDQVASDWSCVLPSADGMRLYLVSMRDSVVQVLGF